MAVHGKKNHRYFLDLQEYRRDASQLTGHILRQILIDIGQEEVPPSDDEDVADVALDLAI